jgi:hypothetical protein
VRIGDDYLNTVTFLCVEEQLDDGVFRPVPRATAFLVLVTEAGLNYYYVVTARHCIEEAGRDPLYVRVNRADEGYEDIPSNRADWYTHDAADVAATPFAVPDLALLRVSLIPLFQFVDGDYRFRGRQSVFEQTLATTNGLPVEPGHEVFFLGLFIQHAGRARNLPIARFGAISRMPIEPVAIRRQSGATERISGYLAECRSWGGHSGSPAFWVSPDSVQGIELPHPSGQGTLMAFP